MVKHIPKEAFVKISDVVLHVLYFVPNSLNPSVFETRIRNRCRWYSKIGGAEGVCVVGVRHSSSRLKKMDWIVSFERCEEWGAAGISMM
jgi:hypothetical protein